MSVTNSPASAILRVRRLSSRRPSGRRASSSCDCCPSREPDEWTEWTAWGRSVMERGSQVGGWKTKFKRRLRVFGANSRQLAASRTALHSSSEVARGGRGGRARAPLVRPPNRSSIEHRSNVDISAMFGRVRGAGKATASPRPPRRFDVVALRRLSGGNIRYRRGGCWGVPGCACAAGAVPHRRNRRRRLFPSIRTPSNTVQTPAMTAAGASLRAEPTEGNWNLPSKRRTQSSGRKKTSQQSPASAPCVSCGAPSCTAADAGAMHVGVWSITRASRTRRPLRRYGNEPRRRPPGVSW